VVAEQVLDFVRGRIRALWGDEFPGDLVEAVLSAGFDDVVDARKRLEALAAIRGRPDFVPLAVTFKRVANIQAKAKEAASGRVDEALLREEAERRLLDSLKGAEGQVAALRDRRSHAEILLAVASLKPAVDRLFDEVLVMAEEPDLRANRLALMKRVADLFADIADFRRIQVELPGEERGPASP
jgi:glycyl-tRNA synthetase beta chain